jgi:hypothetical protein
MDANKLEELIQILTLIEFKGGLKNYSKLLQFERENISILYYTELLTKPLMNNKRSIMIEFRMKEINFFNQDESFIRKMSKFISSAESHELFDSINVLRNYFLRFKENTQFYLLLFEEITSFSSKFEFILDLINLFDFDSNILNFCKETLQSIPKKVTNASNSSISICLKILLKLEKEGEELRPFYPNIRLLLLKFDLSINYLELLSFIMEHFQIPREDLTLIFEKFRGIFNSLERFSFYEYFLLKFRNPNVNNEALSRM